MYKELGSQVSVLSASLRNLNHLEKCIELGSTLTTGPLSMYQEYTNKILESNNNVNEKPTDFHLERSERSSAVGEEIAKLKKIPYKILDLKETNWQNLNIQHDLTDKGLAKFVADWKSVLL
jgi:transaldolase